MIGQQIRLVFVGVPPSMNQFNGRTNVQVYRAVKADWTDRVTWRPAPGGQSTLLNGPRC